MIPTYPFSLCFHLDCFRCSGGCAPTGDGDSLTLAVKAASRVNALLIAKGDLNPSHLSKESVKNISTVSAQQ